jgi:hypothetical protein
MDNVRNELNSRCEEITRTINSDYLATHAIYGKVEGVDENVNMQNMITIKLNDQIEMLQRDIANRN